MELEKRNYTPEQVDVLFETIVSLISEGMSLTKALKVTNVSNGQLHQWAKDEDKHRALTLAHQARSSILFDEMLLIADDDSKDIMADGKVNHAAVQRARLQVDSRKWALSKMNPKRFGDQLDITSDGEAIKAPIINISYKPPKEEE